MFNFELLVCSQSIVTIQLTKEEADRYKQCPVVLDFDSGFYIFPASFPFFLRRVFQIRSQPVFSSAEQR